MKRPNGFTLVGIGITLWMYTVMFLAYWFSFTGK